jgi:methyltransferase-like protein/SAM-dependent methyltransferase
MSGAQTTSYDELPYGANCFFYTHPDALATVATLAGVAPPRVECCRVLELGCAAGANLIPMALTLPEARFVGIDLSPRQVAEGRGVIETLGLRNIELEALSILDVGEEFGRFDYIVCHGVYSWVPETVQDKILAVCSGHLAPSGVAYISYNTYPGWHARGIAREMMSFHVRSVADPRARVRSAREFLDSLVRALPAPDIAFAQILKGEAAVLSKTPDSYLFHEHLEEVNHPVYFHEFIARAAGHGLQYLGEARSGGLADQLPDEAREALAAWSPDPIEREQYVDFLCNRTFRRTLLCHANLALKRTPEPEAVLALHASALAVPVSEGPDATTTTAESFRASDGIARLTTNNPIVKTALRSLAEVWPSALSFDELWARVRTRVESSTGSLVSDEPLGLAAALLQCFGSNLVSLHVYPPRPASEPGEYPLASPLARLEAEISPRVTTLLHRHVELGEFERLLLRHLDGTRHRTGLLDALERLIADDEFTIYQGDEPIRDTVKVREILADGLEVHLRGLARQGLLVS